MKNEVNNQVLNVKLENLENSLNDFKKDTKGSLEEFKIDTKKTLTDILKEIRSVVDRMSILENNYKIINNQLYNHKIQTEKNVDIINETLININLDITSLKDWKKNIDGQGQGIGWVWKIIGVIIVLATFIFSCISFIRSFT